MLSKKWLFIVLLFGAITTHAMESEEKKEPEIKYFLEYKGNKFEITLDGLKKSKILKFLWKNYKDYDENDEKYSTFYDQEGNFKIPLETILVKIKLSDDRPFSNVVTVDNIQNFTELSDEELSVDKLELQQLIIQINLANTFKNETILDEAAKYIAKKIKTEQVLLEFLQGKGLIWTIINELPDDFLNHVIKKKLLENLNIPQIKLTGHTDSVESLAWSNDGRLASGSKDNTIRIWDLKTGKIIKILEGHSGRVNSVAWSPNGKLLASGSYDNIIITWDTKTGKIIKILEGHKSSVNSVAWSPKGTLASGSWDGTIIIWDHTTGKPKKTLTDHKGAVTSVAWSPKGTLASGSEDKTIIIWDPITGKPQKTLTDHTGAVISVAWSPKGTLASGSWDRTIIIWDPITGKPKLSLKPKKAIYSVEWSPNDENKLASGSLAGFVKIWNLKTGTPQLFIKQKNRINSVAWSPNWKMLAIGSKNRIITLLALDLFNDIFFKQAITMLALQTWHNKFPEKTLFDITKQKKILNTINTLPFKKRFTMERLGWIKSQKQSFLKQIIKKFSPTTTSKKMKK